jgi:hypothetical protein
VIILAPLNEQLRLGPTVIFSKMIVTLRDVVYIKYVQPLISFCAQQQLLLRK